MMARSAIDRIHARHHSSSTNDAFLTLQLAEGRSGMGDYCIDSNIVENPSKQLFVEHGSLVTPIVIRCQRVLIVEGTTEQTKICLTSFPRIFTISPIHRYGSTNAQHVMTTCSYNRIVGEWSQTAYGGTQVCRSRRGCHDCLEGTISSLLTSFIRLALRLNTVS